MTTKRTRHSADFKAKVALDAMKGVRTLGELSKEHCVHTTQISEWKRQLLTGVRDIFGARSDKESRGQQAIQASLYEEIGRLKVELDWFKKTLAEAVEVKRQWIDSMHAELSIRRQCELIGLCRSSLYYQPAQESEENLKLMRLIDEQYLCTPFYGSRRMTKCVKDLGHGINRKRIQRLMRTMGLEGLAPGPNTSRKHPQHKVYPYLLRNLKVTYPDHVWSVDITYIPMRLGFMYLVAIIDWYNRYVVAWALSNTLDTGFYLESLDEALTRGNPEIFNSDQGVQFTSLAFTSRLEAKRIQISMEGRGRAFDNIFVERLWRTVKYEDIYLKDYATVIELEQGLNWYFRFYNQERLHQALDSCTPEAAYLGHRGK